MTDDSDDGRDDGRIRALRYAWYADYDRYFGEYDRDPEWTDDVDVYYGDVNLDGFGNDAITVYEPERQDTAWIVTDKEYDLMDYR